MLRGTVRQVTALFTLLSRVFPPACLYSQVLSERSGFDKFYIPDEFTGFPYKTTVLMFFPWFPPIVTFALIYLKIVI